MIGIDAVDVERLREVMIRDPRTEDRLFTAAERSYCRTKADPVIHFAGTLAVKEAVIKAARLGPLLAWGRRIQVHRDDSGVPRVRIEGRTEHRFDISISHDGPVAVAVAVNHGSGAPSARNESSDRALAAAPSDPGASPATRTDHPTSLTGPRAAARSNATPTLRPNTQLQSYIGGVARVELPPSHHLEYASSCELGTDFL